MLIEDTRALLNCLIEDLLADIYTKFSKLENLHQKWHKIFFFWCTLCKFARSRGLEIADTTSVNSKRKLTYPRRPIKVLSFLANLTQ